MAYSEDKNNEPVYHNSHDPEDETTLEEFLDGSDHIKRDKIEITDNGPRKTVTIIKHDNNSGMGEQAPYSISRGFNWGAFLFNFIWGLKYKKFALLLTPIFSCIPYGFILSIVMCIWAGIKGNQWAWEEVQYKDEKDFHNAQQAWVKAWAVCAGIVCIIGIIASIITGGHKQEDQNLSFNIEDYNPIMTLELRIPDKVYEQTDSEDNHAEFLLNQNYIIYWLRAENKLTRKNLEYIEKDFAANKDKLQGKFILSPDLKSLNDENTNFVDMDVEAICINGSDCIDEWLYKSCDTGYCIINPSKRTYYKIRTKESLIPKAITLIKKWEK